MNKEEFIKRVAEKYVSPNNPNDAKQFDPITLAIILAVLSAAIQWVTLRCLDNNFWASRRIKKTLLRRSIIKSKNSPKVINELAKLGTYKENFIYDLAPSLADFIIDEYNQLDEQEKVSLANDLPEY